MMLHIRETYLDSAAIGYLTLEPLRKLLKLYGFSPFIDN